MNILYRGVPVSFRFILILFLLNYTVLTGDAEEVRWVDNSTHTLHPEENISKGKFEIKAVDFDELRNLVRLIIYKEKTIVKEDVLGVGDISIYNDEIKVLITDMWNNAKGDKWVKAEVYLKAEPDLKIDISTNKNEYRPRDSIITTITVRNSGDERIQDVNLIIDHGLLEISGEYLKYKFSEIQAGQSKSLTIEPVVPWLIELQNLTISAGAYGTDMKNVNHTTSALKKINLLPEKSIEVEKKLANNINVGDTAPARITIKNTGAYDLTSIEVIDEIPDGFELSSDTNLRWNMSLARGEERTISYYFKPLMSDVFDIPAATVQFNAGEKKYTAKSNISKIIVHGPELVLTKTVSSSIAAVGDEITITINVRNEGDAPAMFTLTDSSPLNAEILSGNLNFYGVLNKNESQNYSYILRINKAGEIELPAAKMNSIY
ncbi:MAG TPA: hypothetical protein VN368_00060, partial [Candidatus Methylomirabilis sp.]|nr:hypothetical protein [Candidatus Methylomirabilis sp.]